MPAPIHDDEPDVSESVVRALLAQECPQWARLPVEYLETSGTDHAMWRVLDDERPLVVRLPRRPTAARHLVQEMEVLEHLPLTPLGDHVRTPSVRHVGGAHEVFPYPWGVLEWLPGTDAWAARAEVSVVEHTLAVELARVVEVIGTITGVEVAERMPGARGGPLGPLLDRLGRWIGDPRWRADELIDVRAVARLVDQGRELVDEPVTPGFVHGDLIPGNLLVDAGGRLSAVIDWGGAGWGDPAQDLAPAWAVFGRAARQRFLTEVGADDAARRRGRLIELEHAVGGVVYYEPKGHLLGDVMRRTLDRILDDV